MRTDSQDKRDKNYPARIPFVFKGDSIQIQIVMVRPCESHLVIFNLIYLIKPMPSFFDNPDPILLFIVLGFARRMIIKATRQYSIVRQSKCKLRQILAGSEHVWENSEFRFIQELDFDWCKNYNYRFKIAFVSTFSAFTFKKWLRDPRIWICRLQLWPRLLKIASQIRAKFPKKQMLR